LGLGELRGLGADHEFVDGLGGLENPGDAFDLSGPGLRAGLDQGGLHGGPDLSLLAGGADPEGRDRILVGDVKGGGKLEQQLFTVGATPGQKPLITRAKKSIASFKLRAGMPIGASVNSAQRKNV